MKKLLTIVFILLSKVAISQEINFIVVNYRIYQARIVDSTLSIIDTSYKVDNNKVYRTTTTIFQEDTKEKQWRKVENTYEYKNDTWVWYSSKIEPFITYISSIFTNPQWNIQPTLQQYTKKKKKK